MSERRENRAERRRLEAELAALPSLAKCPEKELRCLAVAGREVTLPAGWSVIAERTPADGSYVLLSGQVLVRAAGRDVATLGAGSLFGETGLLDKQLRTATVTTLTRVRLLAIPYGELEQLLGAQPHVADALLADYRRRSAATST